ncbi:MAG: hypothetical protein IK143_00635 [Bacteroidales bacterium]|nr:hypothetical protein [Bacteroidales bacterium]
MKKFILMIMAATMVTLNARAQDNEPRSEIGLFYGLGSASDVISTFTAGFSFSTGDQTGFWGPVGVEYYYHLTPVVAVGAIAEYAGCKLDNPFDQDGSMSVQYLTVMPSVKFNWLRKRHFGLYSSLAAGVMATNINPDEATKRTNEDAKDETVYGFMFQASALGVEFGGALRGFTEFGIGEKGILCLGLRYRF